ncbi:hypothetical protein C8K30_10363 [Promicromonospora sp. AC04]|uniref:hypothetical protein n=1 Tax=Promicromonospora sp. AC04 TaxID=2135723 RepID=UPI000D36D8DD|nr:hypothetical protein [Promicromonospora sp. AC04]PUB28643.1 hypothetical protein C8K30_10363 [Promicromonospora sp. AC04]
MNGTRVPPGDPTAAFAAAVELLIRAVNQLQAAVEVDWEAPAARLYREEVAEAALAVAQDLLLLKEAMRRADLIRVAGLPR